MGHVCKYKGRKPTRVVDLLRMLLQHYLPELNEGDYERIIMQRGGGHAPAEGVGEVLLAGDNQKMAMDAFDDGDVEGVEEDVKKAKGIVQKSASTTTAETSPAAGAGDGAPTTTAETSPPADAGSGGHQAQAHGHTLQCQRDASAKT